MDLLYFDFSDSSVVKIEDLVTGNRYISRGDIVGDEDLVGRIGDSISKARKLNGENFPQVGHWVERNWHACLPIYLSSRKTRYLDGCRDRTKRLQELFDKYESIEACPIIRKPDAIGAAFLVPSFDIGAPEWLEDLISSIERRSTKRRFKGSKISADDFLNTIGRSIVRVRGTAEWAKILDSAEKYTKSFGAEFSYYYVIYDICGIESGIYFHSVVDGLLIPIKFGNFRDEFSYINFGMKSPLTANYSIILVAHPKLYAWRYRHERALRNLFIEGGRLMHEHVLMASSQNIQGVVTPATRDSRLCQLLALSSANLTAIPIYTGTFGKDEASKDGG
ncbi:hypothetical protein [Pandoraea communis]|uniref:hypothetical protein n=1 Tax=Pandoraea communis TaxID=2508297 RepID=UPI0025A5622E|nr:hypothetical protein [Pandoraea communis]MDM8355707.1 hypothetical protein [Pandoraea communis]